MRVIGRIILDVACKDRIAPRHQGQFLAGETAVGTSHDNGAVWEFLFWKAVSILPNDLSRLFKHCSPSPVNPQSPLLSTADSLSKGSASQFKSFTNSRWMLLGCRSIVRPKESPRKKRCRFRYLLCKMISNASASVETRRL